MRDPTRRGTSARSGSARDELDVDSARDELTNPERIGEDWGVEIVASSFTCACCGEVVGTSVDLSQGEEQEYVEDCAVCCRPNVLTVRADVASGSAWIEASFEG